MTESPTADRSHLEKRRRYRRFMNVSLGIGITGLFAACAAWVAVPADVLVLTGVGIYWLGFLGYIGISKTTSITLFDEREEQIEVEAGSLTMTLFATIVVFATPTVVALDITDIYTVPSLVWGVITGYILLFIVFGIAHSYVKRKRS